MSGVLQLDAEIVRVGLEAGAGVVELDEEGFVLVTLVVVEGDGPKRVAAGDVVGGAVCGDVVEPVDLVVVEGGVVVGVEGDEGGAQPRLVAVDGGGEGLAEVSVVDAGERFVGVGSPGLLAQCRVDLGVLDDVGPVGEDPAGADCVAG